MLKSLGANLETFYFAFGDSDAYVISEGPDNITAAAISLTISATGTVNTKTVVLLTPEEIDLASKKTVPFRAPGDQKKLLSSEKSSRKGVKPEAKSELKQFFALRFVA
jgi:hypothetical protein